MQFHANYFKEINKYLAPHFLYDSIGNIQDIKQPLLISPADQSILMSYFWKMDANRVTTLDFYAKIRQHITDLQQQIQEEITKD